MRTSEVSGTGYDLLVVLHVLSAVVGFGAIAVTGSYAARARSVARPREDAQLCRYFRKGTNWAERALFLTPVLGAALLWGGDSSAVSQAWPWIGLSCWVLAAGVASARCWPAERRIQAFIEAKGDSSDPDANDLASFQHECRSLQWGASVIALLFLVAVVVMIGQPH